MSMINYSQAPDPYRQPMKATPRLFIIKSKHPIKYTDGTASYEFVYFPISPRSPHYDPEFDGDPNWVYMMANPKDATVSTYGGCMINIMYLNRPKDYEIVPRNKWVEQWVEPSARPFWKQPNFKKTLNPQPAAVVPVPEPEVVAPVPEPEVVAPVPEPVLVNPFATKPKPNPFERLAARNPFASPEKDEPPKKPSFTELFKKKTT